MKRPKPQKHWTETSPLDYQSRITFDFLAQLEKKMEVLPMSQAELARKLGISESAVSQVLNNPAGLNLSTIIKYSRSLGLKVAIVAYDDDDPDNFRGLVNSEIFSICWEKQGKPNDFFALEDSTPKGNVLTSKKFADEPIAQSAKGHYSLPYLTAIEGGQTNNDTTSNTEVGVSVEIGIDAEPEVYQSRSMAS